MNERTIVFLVAAVQFVNVLDFMIMMPLGPDVATALDIPVAHIGMFGGVYTLAAAATGLTGSRILDRFDRRAVLAIAMLGLALGTAAGGFSVGLWSLLASRIVAGAFGGPATSIALAIIGDAVPPARRGKAIGSVMAAFSAASVLGVPAGLEAARLFGWRASFFGVALLGLVLLPLVFRALPPLTAHLADNGAPSRTGSIPFDPLTRATLLGTACTMVGVFLVVPNLSAFLQNNLGLPRERLGFLYLVGGLASLVANRLVGSLVDRFGATPSVLGGTVTFGLALYFTFIDPVAVGNLAWIFCLLMVSATLRAVPMQSLATRVPPSAQRARFMSAQNAVQHLSSAAGAFGASLGLTTEAGGRLSGMERVALVAIGISMFVPLLAGVIERGVKAREATPS